MEWPVNGASGKAGAAVSAALATLATLAIAGCQAQVDTEREAERLIQTSRSWSEAAHSRDVERMLAYWTDDALVIAPGQPERRGKAAIRQYLLASFATPGFRIHWEPVDARVADSGDLGYLVERTEVTVTGPEGRPLTQRFRSVSVWRKGSDGAWRNQLDISNAGPGSPR